MGGEAAAGLRDGRPPPHRVVQPALSQGGPRGAAVPAATAALGTRHRGEDTCDVPLRSGAPSRHRHGIMWGAPPARPPSLPGAPRGWKVTPKPRSGSSGYPNGMRSSRDGVTGEGAGREAGRERHPFAGRGGGGCISTGFRGCFSDLFVSPRHGARTPPSHSPPSTGETEAWSRQGSSSAPAARAGEEAGSEPSSPSCIPNPRPQTASPSCIPILHPSTSPLCPSMPSCPGHLHREISTSCHVADME